MGRTPKPTALRLLNNNAGKRPLNLDEPQFQESDAQPPEEVLEDPIALKEWQKRAPELIDKGLLCTQYETEFAEYCLQHSLVKNLRIEANKLGVKAAIADGLFEASSGGHYSEIANRGQVRFYTIGRYRSEG